MDNNKDKKIDSIIKRIMNSMNIVISSHVHPDGDAIGSVLALSSVLIRRGKNIRALIDFDIPPNYNSLFDCSIIEKPKDYINAELLIVLDTVANSKRIGRVFELINAPILTIDHHKTNNCISDLSFVDSNYSSTCEIVFEMINRLAIDIDKEIAEYLYLGVATDTNFFQSDSVTTSTFNVAAKLREIGADIGSVSRVVHMRSIDEVKLEGEARTHIRKYMDGKVIGLFLDKQYKDLEQSNSLIESMRTIEGAELVFLMQFDKENCYRVRMRSKWLDISELAKNMGGGGHAYSAGFTIYSDYDSAKEILLNEIRELVG